MSFGKGFVFGGRFTLRRVVYRSAINEVFSAWDGAKRQEVILKVAKPDPDDAGDDRNVLRLQREAVALATLAHPRIVRPIASGFGNSGSFLAIEMLDGVSLDIVLDRDQRMPLRHAVQAGAQALEALEAVHAAGLVHRDVKPGNLMVTRSGVTLIDFGLVTLAPPLNRRARRITGEYRTVGTPSYMAPEQCKSDPDLDGRADLYGVGHVLYQALTGCHAFDCGSGTHDALESQHRALPIPFSMVAPRAGIPVALERVVMRALEKRPRDRFQSAHEMREALLAAAP